MRKEKLLAIMFFLVLVHEEETTLAYYNDMWTPARLVSWFSTPMPIKVSFFELGCLWLLFANRKYLKSATIRPMVRAVYASMIAMLVAVIYGIARGGQLQPINTQAHVWLFACVFALTTMSVLTKAEDYVLMHNAIVWAAFWRAGVAITFYLKVRSWPWDKMPSYMTTHEDTVLFVVGVLILVSRAIENRSKKALRMLLVGAPIIVTAIHLNNRRLAWASLAAGILVMYLMLPAKSKVTQRVNRILRVLAPVLILYVTIGWGRPEKIFKPLAAFSSMSGQTTDNSVRARNNENLSLITMIRDRPLLGTGMGHEWIDLDTSYDVLPSVFPMYHYSPHNSVLALFAFCGALGFCTLWLVMPISVFLGARAYRKSQVPAERTIAIIGIVEVIAYLNQAYGDMAALNLTHMLPTIIIGFALGSSARIAVISGAWPSPSRGGPKKMQSPREGARS